MVPVPVEKDGNGLHKYFNLIFVVFVEQVDLNEICREDET